MSGSGYDDLLAGMRAQQAAAGSEHIQTRRRRQQEAEAEMCKQLAHMYLRRVHCDRNYSYPASGAGSSGQASAPMSYSQALLHSQTAAAQSSTAAAAQQDGQQQQQQQQQWASSHSSPPPASHRSTASDASPSSPASAHGGDLSGERFGESQHSSPYAHPAPAAGSAPHVGPLPAPSAGLRSFVEMGTEESDVEFVQNQIDYHWSKCKEDVMARLVARQRRLEDEQRRLDSFRQSYVTHVNALQEEIERLKEANLKGSREAERHRGQQENMVGAWTAQHHQVVGLRLKAAAWGAWRRQFNDEMTAKRLTAKFAIPHHRRRVLVSVLSAWRTQARASKRVADEKYWRDQVQQTTTNLIADYEKNLGELRHQLAQAEDVIRYHHEDQSMMEEKLKQAFIRGVCALNREALSVFTTPAEVAEANIRSHFSASNVGQGAFMSAAAAAIARNNAGSPPAGGAAGAGVASSLPPATNPSASPMGAGGVAGLDAAPTGPPALPRQLSQPSAPLPSSFVGSTSGAGSLANVGMRAGAQQQQTQQQQPQPAQQQRPLSASVGRPASTQLPYPPHSHAPPSTGARAPHAHPHPHAHPAPHAHSHAHPLPQQQAQRGPAAGPYQHPLPQPRQGAPRPYGAK